MSEDMTQVCREIEETSKKVIGVSDKVTELEKSVQCANHSDKTTEKEEKCKKKYTDMQADLNRKIAEMDTKLNLSEKHDLKYDLLFYGFTEENNENVQYMQR